MFTYAHGVDDFILANIEYRNQLFIGSLYLIQNTKVSTLAPARCKQGVNAVLNHVFSCVYIKINDCSFPSSFLKRDNRICRHTCKAYNMIIVFVLDKLQVWTYQRFPHQARALYRGNQDQILHYSLVLILLSWNLSKQHQKSN